MLRKAVECQTEFKAHRQYESYDLKYSGSLRVGREHEFLIKMRRGTESGNWLFSFKEVVSQVSSKFCIYDSNAAVNYSVYTDCLAIPVCADFMPSGREFYQTDNKNKNLLVLLSVEKINRDGFYCKIHDINHQSTVTEEFFLYPKSNGTYHRLNKTNENLLSIVINNDLRPFLFELTFATNLPQK